MKKLILIACLLATHVCATGVYSTIAKGVTLYSESYPNPKASFKGTIIFENASGYGLNEWKKNKDFLQCAQPYGNLFFYDHNGLSKSPPDLNLSASNPLTVQYNDDKLLKLLQKNKIKPPYILVAHSYGGLFAGYFALAHPDLVTGLLMVDPVPRSYHYSATIENKFSAVVAQAKNESSANIYKNFAPEDAEIAYLLLGFESSKQQLKELGSINNNIPVIILSTVKMEHNDFIIEDWYASQKQWLNNNSKSKIIRIDTGHEVQFENPQAICEQIKYLVSSNSKAL